MEMMQIAKLKSHPRNSEFFDDIVGDAWEAFLESIRTSGVIEPVIITADYTIVSGHQRVRACRELGITATLVDIRQYDSEDEILKQLIETNIRQRGVGNPNPVKLGRCIKELERIYGIEKGGDRKSKRQNVALKTQNDLAEELGLTTKQLQRYKSLTDLIPELQDAVQTGTITATTAMGVVKKLSPEEQQELAESLLPEQKYTQRDIQSYIDKIKDLESRKPEVIEKVPEDVINKLQKLETENLELQSRTPAVEIKEVVPEDYDQLKKQISSMKSDYNRMNQELQERNSELQAARSQLEDLTGDPDGTKLKYDADRDADAFYEQTRNYIERFGGYVWVCDHLDELSDYKRDRFIKCINNLNAFATQMMINIGGLINE